MIYDIIKQKRIHIHSIIFLLIFFISFLNASFNVTLQLRWKHAFQFAGFYMAKEKGFYNKYDINVTIKEIPKDFGLIRRVVNQKESFGVTLFSDLVYAKLKHKDVVSLMPIFSETPYAIIALNPKVKTIKDLKGRSFCLPKYNLRSLEILSLLRENGIRLKDLNIVLKNYSMKDFINRTCDAFLGYTTDQPYYLKKKGIKFKVFSLKKENIKIYGDTLFTSNKFRFAHPKVVENFVKASKEGWRYAISHIDETINIILKKYNTQHFSYDKLLDEALKTKELISRSFEFDIKRVKYIKLIYKVLFNIGNDFKIVEFLYTPYIVSEKELDFIKNNVIKTVNTINWPPFVYDKKGIVRGIGIDFFNIVRSYLFLEAKDFYVDKFTEVLNSIKTRKYDITFSTSKTADRSKYALFSIPYVTYPISIATKSNIDYIQNINELRNKKVAIGYKYTAYELVKKKYPFINIIPVKNTEEGIELLEKGKVDAVIDIMPVLAYYISKKGYYDLIINGDTNLKFRVSFMIRKDYDILKSLIDRIIEKIPEDKKREILNKHINVNIQKGVPIKTVTLQKNIFIFIIGLLILLLIVTIIFLIENLIIKNKLHHLAFYDELTNIYNRRAINNKFKEVLKFASRYNEVFSIIYFDIDHFKKINDRYGHDIGDFVLKEVAQLVKSNIRSTDYIGRYGGEEFLIILPKTNKEQARQVAEKIRKLIENHNFNSIKVTISLGVATYKKYDDMDSLLIRADKALYKAKNSGRNRVVTEDEI